MAQTIPIAPNSPINAPPDRVVTRPPVEPQIQELPFTELTWENFERLCYQLAKREGHIEQCDRYGRAGQAQGGIDIYARRADGRYNVWQSKRYDVFSSSDLKDAVAKFVDGSWKSRTAQLVIAVASSLADARIQDRVEEHASMLRGQGIQLLVDGQVQLSDRLRQHPDLVHQFFGRHWSRAFLGDVVAPTVVETLDGHEYGRIWSELGKVYDSHFRLLDPSVAYVWDGEKSSEVASIVNRFVEPNVDVPDASAPPLQNEDQAIQDHISAAPNNVAVGEVAPHPPTAPSRFGGRGRVKRLSFKDWLRDADQFVIVGDVGMGKSTILRCLALDILGQQRLFPDAALRWGSKLPILIPFALWTRMAALKGGPIGLKEVVRATLQQVLTADLIGLLDRAVDDQRVLLLIDGLDEWSDEQAARLTLNVLLTFANAHRLPTVVTARPGGFARIGGTPIGWAHAVIAPLSRSQQHSIAHYYFERAVNGAGNDGSSASIDAQILGRIDRFFVEIDRDQQLAALAEVPLLLAGLIVLSLRQIALPTNKIQALKKLVEILLDLHPTSRATASGDARSRFVHLKSVELRQAALARLAYKIRVEGLDAGLPIVSAKKEISDHLRDPAEHGFSQQQASDAADEILAVNAETVGLLVERSPGEVAFSHAIFAEFSAAVYLQGRPLNEMLPFVSGKAGEPRWRNVLVFFISLLERREEVDKLVEQIEAQSLDAIGSMNREQLLAELAFGSAKKSPLTARRLVARAVHRIEYGGNLAERRAILASAIDGMADRVTGAEVEARLRSWSPRRRFYASGVFRALEAWPRTTLLRRALWRALHDEERDVQKGAASALAAVFGGDVEVGEELYALATSSLDISVAAAALEALIAGWSEHPDLPDLRRDAVASRYALLQLIGLRGKSSISKFDDRDKEAVIWLLQDIFSPLTFWDLPSAGDLLLKGWKDDPRMVSLCLNSVKLSARRGQIEINRTEASRFLLGCDTSDPSICSWILDELKSEFPFGLNREGGWNALPRFLVHKEIRDAAVSFAISDNRLGRFQYRGFYAACADDRVRDALVAEAATTEGMDTYWCVAPLVEGWGRADALVRELLEDIGQWSPDRLTSLARLLPKIIVDRVECREKLLQVGRHAKRPRYDLLAAGFAELGCDGHDSDVVDVLLSGSERGRRTDDDDGLFQYFASHPEVRRRAVAALSQHGGSLTSLAIGYASDTEIASRVLEAVTSLPSALRAQVTDHAAVETNLHSAVMSAVRNYSLEADPELSIRSAIIYHSNIARFPRADPVDTDQLVRTAVFAVGPDYAVQRAAALASLVVLSSAEKAALTNEARGEPSRIPVEFGVKESTSFFRLLVEHWNQIKNAYGNSFAERFGDFGRDPRGMWERLGPHLVRAGDAERDFLFYCGGADARLGAQGLRALARARPGSQLLYEHCIKSIARPDGEISRSISPLGRTLQSYEACYLLKDHFAGKNEVHELLRENVKVSWKALECALLAIYAPTEELLNEIPMSPVAMGLRHNEWSLAIHLAAARSEPVEFVNTIKAMVSRNVHTSWDFQEFINRAVIERLRHDSPASECLTARVFGEPSGDEMASIPRYLLAAGCMNRRLEERCRDLLERQVRTRTLPLAGFDAMDGVVRSVAQSLLDIISPSFGR